MGIVWDAHDYPDPFLMPPDHQWEPTSEHVIELLVYCIFEAQNPETKLQHVTGANLPSEYNLRECIAYDAIEYKTRALMSSLLKRGRDKRSLQFPLLIREWHLSVPRPGT